MKLLSTHRAWCAMTNRDGLSRLLKHRSGALFLLEVTHA